MKQIILILLSCLIISVLSAQDRIDEPLDSLLSPAGTSHASDSLMHFFSGKLYFDNELYLHAIEQMTHYVIHNPNGLFASEALFYIGRSYVALDSTSRAIGIFQKTSELFTFDEFGILSLLEIAEVYFSKKDYDLAKLFYTHFIYFNIDLKYKDNAFLMIEKCNYYFGLYESPTEIYRQFIKKYPNSSLIPKLKLELAKYYYSIQEYSQAIIEYNQILHEFSAIANIDSVYFTLAQAYRNIGELNKSMEMINKLVTHHPQSPLKVQAYQMLIDRLVSEHKFLSAIDTLNKIIEKTPLEERNSYYSILAQIYEELGLNQELVYIYQIMIQQETDVEKSALLRLKLETIKAKTGKTEDSLKPINHKLER